MWNAGDTGALFSFLQEHLSSWCNTMTENQWSNLFFRYYLFCLLVVLVGMATVHFTVISYGTAPIWSGLLYAVTFLIVLGVNVAAWTGFVWVKLIVSADKLVLTNSGGKPNRSIRFEPSMSLTTENHLSHLLQKKNEELSRFPRALHMRLGNLITHSRKVRLLIWLVCSFFIIVLALMGLAIMPHSRNNANDAVSSLQ